MAVYDVARKRTSGDGQAAAEEPHASAHEGHKLQERGHIGPEIHLIECEPAQPIGLENHRRADEVDEQSQPFHQESSEIVHLAFPSSQLNYETCTKIPPSTQSGVQVCAVLHMWVDATRLQ